MDEELLRSNGWIECNYRIDFSKINQCRKPGSGRSVLAGRPAKQDNPPHQAAEVDIRASRDTIARAGQIIDRRAKMLVNAGKWSSLRKLNQEGGIKDIKVEYKS